MPILAFITSAIYIPGLVSASVAPRWWAILIAAPVLMALRSTVPIRWTVGHLLGLTFLIYAATSLLWAFDPLQGIGALVQFAALALIFQIASEAQDLRRVWLGLALGFVTSVPFVVMQLFGSRIAAPLGGIAGLFLNRDNFAEALVVALAGILSVKNKNHLECLAMLSCFIMLACSGSRGALLALGAVVFFYAMHGRPFRQWLMIATPLVLAAGALIWLDSQDAWRSASVTNRFDFWAWTLANLKPFGWGFASYGSVLPWDHAHNDLMEAVFDLGIGSITFVAFIVVAFRGKLLAERLVLVAVLAEGLVSFPLHEPVTLFATALALGRLYGARDRLLRSEPDQRDRDWCHAHRWSLSQPV